MPKAEIIINTIEIIINNKNISLQPTESIIIPPTVGAKAGAIPIIKPNKPIYACHFSLGMTLRITICVIGSRMPPPIP